MDKNIIELKEKFQEIKGMGWIEEKKKGLFSMGDIFEKLLGKKRDEFFFPDYEGIEIKTINNNTKTNLHLFCLTPNGDDIFPIKRIVKEFGCPDKTGKYRIFFRSFKTCNYTKIGLYKNGKIYINYTNKRIELNIYNSKWKRFPIKIYWNFDDIMERLNIKMQYLAIVKVFSKIMNEKGYYYYDDIRFYKLKSFETFIYLIDKGIISITFKIGVFKSLKRIGEIYDHGTDFSISMKDIPLLFDEIKM